MQEDLTNQEKEYLQLATWIAEQLALGRSREDVIRDVVGTGIEENSAAALVDAVIASASQSQSAEDSSGSAVRGWVIAGVVFLGLNALLYVGQEWYHADDVRRCEEIERELAEMNQEIAAMERYLEGRQRERKALLDLESKLKHGESRLRGAAAYDRAYSDYSKRVDRYNAEVELATAMVAKYESTIAVYNKKVDEYNRLAKSAYSRWHLIPLPRGSGKSLGRRVPSQ